VLRLLGEARFDKIKGVRESVARAARSFSDLGAPFSPIRMVLSEDAAPEPAAAAVSPAKPGGGPSRVPAAIVASSLLVAPNEADELRRALASLQAAFQAYRADTDARLARNEHRIASLELQLAAAPGAQQPAE
jgi:hypothetical protein